MTDVRITIPDLAPLEARFDGATGIVNQELQRAMTGSVQLIQHSAQANAPVKTGKLRGSIVSQASGLNGMVEATASYAKYIEYGRGPVRPVNARALHFVVDGKEVFTKYAGPAAARPFFFKALTQNQAAIRDKFVQAIQRIIAQLGGA